MHVTAQAVLCVYYYCIMYFRVAFLCFWYEWELKKMTIKPSLPVKNIGSYKFLKTLTFNH